MQKNNLPVWPLVVFAAIAAGVVYLGDRTIFVDPGAPDMVAVFAANEDRAEAKLHAYAMGTICESLADVIEYDGTLSSPKFVTGVQLEELRTLTRKYRMRGWSFADKYPTMGSTMESFLNDAIGKNGGKIDAEGRRRWVEAYRQIGKSCKYAADRG